MSGRKVRKDFDKTKEYSVDVSKCTKKEKKEVQRAFFDVGIAWVYGDESYQNIDAMAYTNKLVDGRITPYFMYDDSAEDCNMTAKEFLDLVYEPEIKGHVHAELMAQYAEDAKSTTKPWELWQVKGDDGDWWPCRGAILWGPDTEYRRKPKTHCVHGIEIPDLRVTPKYDEYYYLADPSESEFTYHFLFRCDSQDNTSVERGLAYQDTEEGKQAAILHAKAMLGIA